MEMYHSLLELERRSTPEVFKQGIKRHYEIFGSGPETGGRDLSLCSCGDLDLLALDQWAYLIIRLVNYCKDDVVANLERETIVEKRHISHLFKNEYDRFLWLCQNKHQLFEMACKTLERRELYDSRSDLSCSMYKIKDESIISKTDINEAGFRNGLKEILWYSGDEITVTSHVYSASSPFSIAPIIDVTIAFNKAGMDVNFLKQQEVVTEKCKCTGLIYVVYHCETGILEVYAPESIDRNHIASIFSERALQSDKRIRKLFFDFGRLEHDVNLSCEDAYVSSAKVTSLNFKDKKAIYRYEVNENNRGKIHEAVMLNKDAEFGRVLTHASIKFATRKTRFPPQETTIRFFERDYVKVDAINQAGRWKVSNLLSQWGLLLEDENELYCT